MRKLNLYVLNIEEIYRLQDFIIKNLETYVNEKKYEKVDSLPNYRLHFRPEAYYLALHLKYLKRVRDILGLNSFLIRRFYAKIYLNKHLYKSPLSIPFQLKYYIHQKYGKERCCVTGDTTMHSPIHYHKIFPEEMRKLKTKEGVSRVLPLSDSCTFLLEDTKEMLEEVVRILINTYMKNYKYRPYVIEYSNVISYFEKEKGLLA